MLPMLLPMLLPMSLPTSLPTAAEQAAGLVEPEVGVARAYYKWAG
jgi:hypothetical protein